MKINLDTPSEDVQIQIIPLIDVIFCILTFFILAALQLTRQQAISVDVPTAATGTTQMREMLVVTINATGQTYVEKELVDRSQLYQILQTYHQQNPNGLLVLNASKMAFYNDVVQVIDIMRAVGGDRVALATLPAEPNASPTPGAFPAPTATPPIDPYNIFGTPSPGSTFNPANPGQLQSPAGGAGQSQLNQPQSGQSPPLAPQLPAGGNPQSSPTLRFP